MMPRVLAPDDRKTARPRPGARGRGLAGALALVALLGLAAASPAFAEVFTPDASSSPNGDDISTLYEITLYIAIVVFVGVEGTLLWSLLRYRARRDGPEPAQIRGNTPLEIGWTLGAALILVLLTVVTFLYLGDIQNPPAAPADSDLKAAKGVRYAALGETKPPGADEPLQIGVNGQQYLWRYDYAGYGEEQLFSYYEMVVPVGRPVELSLTASDVIHSWWIPELGGKADAVPGHTNRMWFQAEREGVYAGQCAELCGAGHADMRAVVRAVPADDFEAWAERQRSDIAEAKTLLAEQREQIEQSED
jgi:cytochrome c oxidase subunit II